MCFKLNPEGKVKSTRRLNSANAWTPGRSETKRGENACVHQKRGPRRGQAPRCGPRRGTPRCGTVRTRSEGNGPGETREGPMAPRGPLASPTCLRVLAARTREPWGGKGGFGEPGPETPNPPPTENPPNPHGEKGTERGGNHTQPNHPPQTRHNPRGGQERRVGPGRVNTPPAPMPPE